MSEHRSPAGWTPQPKVAAGGIAGGLATVIVFILTSAGLEVPEVVATAIGALAAAAVAYIVPNTEVR